VFLNNEEWQKLLHEQEVKKEVLDRYSQARRKPFLAQMYFVMWAARMFALIPDSSRKGPLLEIMAGEGELVRRLPTNITKAAAIDLNVHAIEKTTAFFVSQQETRIYMTCGTAARFPFPNESFNSVMVMGGLHHVRSQLMQVLSEVHRVLKPGGVFIGSEPANDGWLTRGIRRWQYRFSKYQGDDPDEDGFTCPELKKLLTNSGFDLTTYNLFGFIAYPLMGNMDLLPLLSQLRSQYLGKMLLSIDELLAHLPIVRHWAWANLFRADKKSKSEEI
jgi:ubiquinone/menaquinone biosynthesis C-methylase UbiE